jgi:hypothetical protein
MMQASTSRAAGPAEAPISKTGAEIIVDALLAHGVDTVFGHIPVAKHDHIVKNIRNLAKMLQQGGQTAPMGPMPTHGAGSN